MENNLFTSNAFAELKSKGIKVEERAVIEYRAVVTICGETFNGVDLRDTVSMIAYDNAGNYLTDPKMIKMLKSIGVLEYEGSNRSMMSCQAGPNVIEFLEFLNEEMKSRCVHYERLVE